MKKTAAFFLLFIFNSVMYSQNNVKPTSFVIGLPKISFTQLNLIKQDFEAVVEIKAAEFVFKDNIAMIEANENSTKKLTYNDIETILKKYFNVNDIYQKEYESLKLLKAEYNKVDKYTLK